MSEVITTIEELNALEPAWLETAWQLYVGVQTPLEAKHSVELLMKHLDMKLGSSDRVDDIFRQGSAGLKFVHEPQPPQRCVSLQVTNGAQPSANPSPQGPTHPSS
jgi:hypothetical protein